jgi:hypothetical protein
MKDLAELIQEEIVLGKSPFKIIQNLNENERYKPPNNVAFLKDL